MKIDIRCGTFSAIETCWKLWYNEENESECVPSKCRRKDVHLILWDTFREWEAFDAQHKRDAAWKKRKSPFGDFLFLWYRRYIYETAVITAGENIRDHCTVICFTSGFAGCFFGSVSFSTPFSYAASMRSASTLLISRRCKYLQKLRCRCKYVPFLAVSVCSAEPSLSDASSAVFSVILFPSRIYVFSLTHFSSPAFFL